MSTENFEQQLRSLAQHIQPDDYWLGQTKKQFIAQAKNSMSFQEIQNASRLNIFGLFMNRTFAVMVATLITAGFVLSILFAGTSKPGDILYDLDKGIENIELAGAKLFGGEITQANVYLRIAEERIDEMAEIVGTKSQAIALIRAIQAENSAKNEEISVSAQQTEYLEELTDEFELALAKATEALERAVGKEADQTQLEELAESILSTTVDVENTLVVIRSHVDNETSFILDNAVLFTVEVEGELFETLYYDLAKGQGDEHQALPEAKVGNRIAKAKREIEKIRKQLVACEEILSAEKIKRATVLLTAMSEAVTQGEDKFEEGDLEDAYIEITLAYDLARQIRSELNKSSHSQIKLEREAKRAIRSAERKIRAYTKRNPEIGISEELELLEQAKTTLEKKDYETTIGIANQINVLLQHKKAKEAKEAKETKKNKKIKGTKKTNKTEKEESIKKEDKKTENEEKLQTTDNNTNQV